VYDGMAAVVYACRADYVRWTIVGGEVVLDDRVVVGIDEKEAISNFHRLAWRSRDRSLAH